MPSFGQSITVEYVAWNTSTNAGQTGDAANHTLRWIKDGTSSAPTNSLSEVDATNAPGIYKLTLTDTECQCNFGTLGGKSSTANVSIIPVKVTFETLPLALDNNFVKASVEQYADNLDPYTMVVLNANGVETGVTVKQALRAIAAILAGVIADSQTGTEAFAAIGNSGTTRVTVTVDASGNRSAVTLNL